MGIERRIEKYGSEAGIPITAEEQTDQSDQLTKSSVTPNDHQVFFHFDQNY